MFSLHNHNLLFVLLQALCKMSVWFWFATVLQVCGLSIVRNSNLDFCFKKSIRINNITLTQLQFIPSPIFCSFSFSILSEIQNSISKYAKIASILLSHSHTERLQKKSSVFWGAQNLILSGPELLHYNIGSCWALMIYFSIGLQTWECIWLIKWCLTGFN